jgi:hypothetical protein
MHDGGMRQTGLTLSPVIGCLWGDVLTPTGTRNSANMLPFLQKDPTASLIISSARGDEYGQHQRGGMG